MEEQIKILLEWVFKEVIQYGFRHLFWVVLIVISTLFFGRNYRKRIKALENGQEEADRRQEEASRRAEGFERELHTVVPKALDDDNLWYYPSKEPEG